MHAHEISPFASIANFMGRMHPPLLPNAEMKLFNWPSAGAAALLPPIYPSPLQASYSVSRCCGAPLRMESSPPSFPCGATCSESLLALNCLLNGKTLWQSRRLPPFSFVRMRDTHLLAPAPSPAFSRSISATSAVFVNAAGFL